jgi:hypothetical protein
MNFLRALYSGNPKEHGYLITPDFYPVNITENEDLESVTGIKIIFPDRKGQPEKLLIHPEDHLSIQYDRDHSYRPMNLDKDRWVQKMPMGSELNFSINQCRVRFNGTTFDYSMVSTGKIVTPGVPTMLPDKFMLEA